MRILIITSLTLVLSIGCEDSTPNTPEASPSSDTESADDSSGSVFDFGESGPDTPPEPTCATDAECDDGLACTTDTCSDEGEVQTCRWALVENTCLINSICYQAADIAPNDACLECEPTVSTDNWTRQVGVAQCDDGESCTEDDSCTETGCEGTAISCDDGLACTTDSCVAGACQFIALECNDGNQCTDDSCDDSGDCLFTPTDAACDLDGDKCTNDVCTDGECLATGSLNCDDGDFCTIDLCDADVGCITLPTQTPCCAGEVALCNDDDPCTDDLCDELTGECSTEYNTANCDDGDPCTVEDTCLAGECAGVAATCDDGNPCTADSCDGGCVHLPVSDTPCDDGLECSTADTCQNGQCVGDTSDCVCEPVFSPVANKVVALQIGTDADIGQGLDLDGDASTCAPSPCSSGVDNALGLIAALANQSLAESVEDGSLILVIEHIDFPGGEGSYSASLYRAKLAPENLMCDLQTSVCDFLVNPGLYDPNVCAPVIELPTELTGDQLTAGGPGTVFPFSIPLSPTASLDIILYNVQLQTTVTLENDLITAMKGVLGGAVQKDNLKEAISELPPDALPLPPEQIAPLLDTLIQNDIDTDGDGVKDAASIGITLEAIATNLVGLGEPIEDTP